MTINSRSELFRALQRKAIDEVLGTAENEWLEFKESPYPLDRENADRDYHKLELAKDVTAFANHTGGVIVFGFATEKDERFQHDIVTQCRPIPPTAVNQETYKSVLRELTYPPIHDPQFEWWPQSGENGVLTVEIEAAPQGIMPILVVRTGAENRRRQILIGVFQRSGHGVAHLTHGELHNYICVGRLISRLPGGVSGALTGQEPGQEELISTVRMEKTFEEDTGEADLAGARRYFLQAWPDSQISLEDMHTSTGLKGMLPRPPAVRDMGFNLQTLKEPSLLPGGGLRVSWSGRLCLSVQPDGLTTLVVSADTNGLAWADEKRDARYSINPLTLVEYTLEFARFFAGQILPRANPKPGSWSIRGGMLCLTSGDPPSSLAPGSLKLQDFAWFNPAPADSFSIGPLKLTNEPPGMVAFKILEKVYRQFGIDKSGIPYSEAGEVKEDLIEKA